MKKKTKVRTVLVRLLFYLMAEPVKPYSPYMFANTSKVYASAKYLAIRVMCVDPDVLVFTLVESLFI